MVENAIQASNIQVPGPAEGEIYVYCFHVDGTCIPSMYENYIRSWGKIFDTTLR